MERTQLQENKRDLAVLVGLRSPVLREDSTDEESLQELAALVETADGEAVGIGMVLACQVEVKTMVALESATLVIFDNDLSPSQIRVLTELLGVQVIDRSGLILDIFAQRAKTREGCLQVELAQYQYLLPRLIGMWTHLERQAGTSGKGPIGSKGAPGPQYPAPASDEKRYPGGGYCGLHQCRKIHPPKRHYRRGHPG